MFNYSMKMNKLSSTSCVSCQNDAENLFHEICFKSWSVWFDQIDELIPESLMSFPISELNPNQSIEVKTDVLNKNGQHWSLFKINN